MAGKNSWSTRKTIQDKINHLRASAAGMLAKAEKLELATQRNQDHFSAQGQTEVTE